MSFRTRVGVAAPFTMACVLLFALACRDKALRNDAADAADAAADAARDSEAEAKALAAEAGPPDAGPLLSDESVLALATTHRYIAGGYLKDYDAPVLEETMRSAYARMREEELVASSAGHLEKLAIEGADAGLLVLAGEKRESGAVVFLHGWGGRWALPCWQIARAVKSLGLTTACPDLGLAAEWWSRDGERVVRGTADALRAAGHKRLVLVGLSNGAAGASRLPARMPGTFAAVVLVSGADPAAPSTAVPTLVLHGRLDQMTPFEAARNYGRRPGARLVQLEAGHFAMLVNAATAETAIADFLTHPDPLDGGVSGTSRHRSDP